MLKQLLTTATFKQSLLTSISTLINGALGALFFVYLARWLGPSDLGAFSIFAAGVVLIAAFVDFGLDQSVVKYSSLSYLKLALLVKLGGGLLVTVITWSLAPTLASSIFHTPQLANLLSLVGLGVLTQTLFSYATTYCQINQKYLYWSLLFIGTNFCRFVLIICLFASDNLTPFTAALTYLLMPFAGFLISLTFLPIVQILTTPLPKAGSLVKFITFNKWVTAFKLASITAAKTDTFFISGLLPLSSTGIYSLGNQLISIFPQLSTALGVVTAPKLASFTTHTQSHTYVTKAFWLSLLQATGASLLLIPAGWWVIGYSRFPTQPTFTSFLILLGSVVIFHLLTPFRDSILYYFNRPQVFFWQNISQLALLLIAYTLLIPRLGVTGAAFSVLLGQIFVACTTLIYYFNRLHVQA